MNSNQPRKLNAAWYKAFAFVAIGYGCYALTRAAIKIPVFDSFVYNLGYYVVSGVFMVGVSWWIAMMVRRRFPNSPVIPMIVMIVLIYAFIGVQQFWLNDIVRAILQSTS